jgi:hypothetical protein
MPFEFYDMTRFLGHAQSQELIKFLVTEDFHIMAKAFTHDSNKTFQYDFEWTFQTSKTSNSPFTVWLT